MSRPARSLRSRRSEAARRNRRLFLEPLETRALLAVVGTDDAYTILEDTPLTVAPSGVLANDSGTSAALISNPQHGSLTFAGDDSFAFTPDTDYAGLDSFL